MAASSERMILSLMLQIVEWVGIPFALFRLLPGWGLRAANFKGCEIPVGFGIYVVLWSISAFALLGRNFALPYGTISNWIILLGAFGGLGFLDDIAGNRGSTGLKGHFSALFRHGKVTTGLIKAIGGVVTAFILGSRMPHGGALTILLIGLIIALSSNAINLLDLRPGRAGAMFFLLSIPLWVSSLWTFRLAPIIFLIPPALLMQWYDSRGKVMMGDAGSNVLGAALGYAFVTSNPSTFSMVAVLLLLTGLHLMAEKVSLSTEIEKRAWLRKLDSLTGVR